MAIDEIVQDIHALEADLEKYERKYGMPSEAFYQSYIAGNEPAGSAWVLDWSDWAGAYEVWLNRRQQYQGLARNLPTAAFSQGWREAQQGETFPVTTLWNDIDAK
jgi:hypothetical protein